MKLKILKTIFFLSRN